LSFENYASAGKVKGRVAACRRAAGGGMLGAGCGQLLSPFLEATRAASSYGDAFMANLPWAAVNGAGKLGACAAARTANIMRKA